MDTTHNESAAGYLAAAEQDTDLVEKLRQDPDAVDRAARIEAASARARTALKFALIEGVLDVAAAIRDTAPATPALAGLEGAGAELLGGPTKIGPGDVAPPVRPGDPLWAATNGADGADLGRIQSEAAR